MKNENIRQQVTDKIVAAIAKGVIPWRRPWSQLVNTGVPVNFTTPHKHYHGINLMLLEMLMYQSRFWGTEAAWKKVHGFIHPTEYAVDVVYFNFIERKIGGKPVMIGGKADKFPVMRLYQVYNAEQVQAPDVSLLVRKSRPELVKMARGFKVVVFPEDTKTIIATKVHDAINAKLERYKAQSGEDRNVDPDFGPAEKLIAATGANIRIGGDRASYNYDGDFIRVPSKRKFDSIADYYETEFHELIHWTEKKGRVGQRKDHTYAFGELVAEIGACYLCAELCVPHAAKMLTKSASYLSEWLKSFGSNPKYIFDAAAQASKAVDYLLKFADTGKKRRKKAA